MNPAVAVAILGLLILAAYRFLPKKRKEKVVALTNVETEQGSEKTSDQWQSYKLRHQPLRSSRLIMAILVSIAVLVSALYIILSQNFGVDSEKWAFGAIGTIIGFWLRPEE